MLCLNTNDEDNYFNLHTNFWYTYKFVHNNTKRLNNVLIEIFFA